MRVVVAAVVGIVVESHLVDLGFRVKVEFASDGSHDV